MRHTGIIYLLAVFGNGVAYSATTTDVIYALTTSAHRKVDKVPKNGFLTPRYRKRSGAADGRTLPALVAMLRNYLSGDSGTRVPELLS